MKGQEKQGIPLLLSKPQEGGEALGLVVRKVQISTVHKVREITSDEDNDMEEERDENEKGTDSKGGGSQEMGLTSSTQSASHQSVPSYA